MCKFMKVSTNAYYNWLKNKDITRPQKATEFLKQRIQAIFKESNEIYGSIRVQKKLEREGLIYSSSYIAQLMKKMGLKSVLKRKFKICTTDSNHTYPVSKNQLNRNFTAVELGQKWVSDITYIKVAGKWNYVTTIIDLADRKLVAWSLSQDMTTQNTIYKTWIKARKIRKITQDHIFHSDRGIQYASNLMTSLFYENKKITQSMSRKGNCWDNAVAESFFKTLKYECTNRYNFRSIFQAESIIGKYINWYNYQRLHSSLDYKTPAEKELEIKINNYRKVA
jgi:transposase InsO family protein